MQLYAQRKNTIILFFTYNPCDIFKIILSFYQKKQNFIINNPKIAVFSFKMSKKQRILIQHFYLDFLRNSNLCFYFKLQIIFYKNNDS